MRIFARMANPVAQMMIANFTANGVGARGHRQNMQQCGNHGGGQGLLVIRGKIE